MSGGIPYQPTGGEFETDNEVLRENEGEIEVQHLRLEDITSPQ
jgi:hypothetical protein